MNSFIFLLVLCALRTVRPMKVILKQPFRRVNALFDSVKNLSSGIQKFVASVKGFDKESNRKFRRTIFTHSDWKRHRSSNRYYKELLNIPFSLVLRGLTVQALGVWLWSMIIVTYNFFIERRFYKIFSFPILSFPALPLSLTSPSLGLLLVFRTNAAYSRWMSGRTSWATISSSTFDLMRQTILWVEDDVLKANLVRQVAAFPRCLKWYLGHRHNERRLRDDLEGVLLPVEIDQLLSSRHPVKHCLLRMSQTLTAASLIPNVQSHMDKQICQLTEEMFECERIYTSPIPLMYTRHTARFLLLWLLTVPMALYHEFGGAKSASIFISVPLISFVHAIFLFGIEELGVQIEEPFSILPLAEICNDIQLSGEELLREAGVGWLPIQHEGEQLNNSSNLNILSRNSTAIAPAGDSIAGRPIVEKMKVHGTAISDVDGGLHLHHT